MKKKSWKYNTLGHPKTNIKMYNISELLSDFQDWRNLFREPQKKNPVLGA